MAYRIDITYDPYTGQVQVCYDGRMEKCIESMLNPESILEKWPIKEFPATTINYRSYDDWEVVDNEFSQQWESEAEVPATQTSPHTNAIDAINQPIAEPIGVDSPDLGHPASNHSSRASTPRSPVSRSPSRSPATPRSPEASADVNMNQDHEHSTALTTVDEMQDDPGYDLECTDAWLEGPTIQQTPKFYAHMKNLGEMQQLACKELAKELIKVWIPHKKSSYPYKFGNQQRPPQWPRGIPHEQPDHISKDLRMCLIAHILNNIPSESLQQVFEVLQVKPIFEHSFRRQLLAQLCDLE